jgi:hypothetical protein
MLVPLARWAKFDCLLLVVARLWLWAVCGAFLV